MLWIPPRKRNQYDPVFANNTWAKIIKACQNKEVPETWTVSNQKAMTINGTVYAIDIIGKGHDNYADGSGKAPLTFQMHDCYGTQYAMNSSNTNSGGWKRCAMRQTHLPAILALMPTEVQNGIREVNKRAFSGTIVSTTVDKLFLLSEIEIFGSITYSKKGEGTQYDYYKAGSSKVKNDRWERSPNDKKSTSFCLANSNGTADSDYASIEHGVAFAFCF